MVCALACGIGARAEDNAVVGLARDAFSVSELRFNVPMRHLAPRIARDLARQGSVTVETVYVIPTVSEVLPEARDDGGRDTVHIFMKLANALQPDPGGFRLKNALADENRSGREPQARESTMAGREVLMYEIPGASSAVLYAFPSSTHRTVFVRCAGFACQGYRTYADKLIVEYRYPSRLRERVVVMDMAIDAFIASLRPQVR